MTPRLTGLDHLVLTVTDISTSVAFYRDVLGMEVQKFRPSDGTTRTAVIFGRHKINLHQAGAEYRPHAHAPTPGSADLCFLTETRLEDWSFHMDRHGVAIEEGPVTRSGATGPIRSLYVRDPDGNLIEISVPVARG